MIVVEVSKSAQASAIDSAKRLFLVFRAGPSVCAVPLSCVVEVMRPLHTETVPDLPPFVAGLSVIRGSPVPVVDLAVFLGAKTGPPVTRFISLRVGARRVALAVRTVEGIRALSATALESAPPLIQGACAQFVEAVGVLDGDLLAVLYSQRILEDGVWQLLEEEQRAGARQ